MQHNKYLLSGEYSLSQRGLHLLAALLHLKGSTARQDNVMGTADGSDKKTARNRRQASRMIEFRCCLVAATVLLAGLSVLYSLSRTQLKLTSGTDYRRLSFYATVRPRQESPAKKPSVCEFLLPERPSLHSVAWLSPFCTSGMQRASAVMHFRAGALI
jgi:hypothetical protein